MAAGGVDERRQGVVTEWNDARGPGFIAPASGTGRLFVHVSAFPRSARPRVGAAVTYAEVRDERHRARASKVRYASSVGARRRSVSSTPLAVATGVLFFAVVMGLVLLGEVPVWTLGSYGLFSAVAFVMYRADKMAAVRGGWRTAESTLHLIDLLGGWPGGLLARHLYRHKTTKQPFRTIFWATVLANGAALGWLVLQG